MTNVFVEQYVKEYGEAYRSVIVNSLEWLDENEAAWHLEKPMDRHEFIKNLVEKASPQEEERTKLWLLTDA